jgi:hypothetical protein
MLLSKFSMVLNVRVRINCIGQLGLGLLPLGPQPIRVRVGEAQLLVLLPPLAAALLAVGLTLMGCHTAH